MKEAMLWAMLIAFFIGWIAFSVYALRKGWSKTIGIGGGFLLSSVVFAVVGSFLAWVSEPFPQSTVVATTSTARSESTPPVQKLSNKKAAENAERNLRLIDTAMKDLQYAVETKDRAGFRQYVTAPLVEASRQWDTFEHSWEFKSCKAALVHAHSFAMTVWDEYFSGFAKGGVWNRKSREMAIKGLDDAKSQCHNAIRQGHKT